MDQLDPQYRVLPDPTPLPLADQEMAEYVEAFSLYDTEGVGTVPLTSLGLVLHSLGLSPNHSTLELLRDKKLLEGETTLSLSEFVHLVRNNATSTEKRRTDAEDKARRLETAFHPWDPAGTGYIRGGAGEGETPLALFRRNLEDTMDAKEVDELIGRCKTETGHVNYVELCSIIAA